jgi:hypothetical protein
VQIQAAIDYAYNAWGGGKIILTEGIFLIDSYITIKTKCILEGTGLNTIIRRTTTTGTTIINMTSSNAAQINNLNLDGTDLVYTSDSGLAIINGSLSTNCTANKIWITNYELSATNDDVLVRIYGLYYIDRIIDITIDGLKITNDGTGLVYASGVYYSDYVINCSCDNIEGEQVNENGAFLYGFEFCNYMCNCYSGAIISSNPQSSVVKAGFSYCSNMTTCLSDNSGTDSIGYFSCKSMQQNKSLNNETPYSVCYADAGTSNAVADTAAGGYNS